MEEIPSKETEIMAVKKTATKPARGKVLADVSPRSKSRNVKGGSSGALKTQSVTNPGTAGSGGH